MKLFGVCFPCDQTVTYLAVHGSTLCETTDPKHAQLWETVDQAERVMAEYQKIADISGWTIEVEDEEEFRSRPKTW